ncbi:MAG TPA: FtsQ-type POTRA domain-containing protein [Candidatus Methylomirabilis sp.]|nr:FtsQ-type POTRA domain-containing protein [Candidatus Methylomirabilis sp.]
MRRAAVLSPRGAPVELPDLASRNPLMAGQRINSSRLRRRVARRARWVATRILLLASGTAVLTGAALATGWVLRSPRFAIASVEVSGQSRLTREEIESTAGIVRGTNLFRLDPRDAVARLESIPLIRRALVIRSFPDRVSVVVEERRPFTLAHAGRLHWVDEEGMDLGLESRPVALGAPVLSGLEADDLGAAHRRPSERAAAGIALLRLLLRAQSPLLGQISEVDVSRREGPVLYTVGGIEVRLGGEDWDARLGRLQGVLAQLAGSAEAVTSIDLRFRDQVVLKTAGK